MTHQHAVETLAMERYLLGEMADQERDALEEHFFSCAECAEDARAAGALRDAVAAGMASRAATRPAGRVLELPAPRRRLASAVVPWAVAASLALVAGYQSFVLQPALKRNAAPIVLSPVTLRPASRGEEPVVFASAGAVVTLAVDLGGVAIDGEAEYEIRHAGGATIASDRVPVPKDGAPLLLLVPAVLFQPSQHYVLFLKNSGNRPLTPAEYRFTVGAR
jgi:anti-sigma factor RsiW